MMMMTLKRNSSYPSLLWKLRRRAVVVILMMMMMLAIPSSCFVTHHHHQPKSHHHHSPIIFSKADDGSVRWTTSFSPNTLSFLIPSQRRRQQQQQQRQRRQSLYLLPESSSSSLLVDLASMTSLDMILSTAATTTPTVVSSSTVTSSLSSSSSLLPTALLQSPAVTQLTTLAQQGGPWVMTLAVAISDAVPLLPTQPISILAGALFGFSLGLPAVVLGQALATLFALLVGRYVLQQPQPQQHDSNSTWWWSSKSSSTKGGNDNNLMNNNNKWKKVLNEMTSGLNSDDWRRVFGTIVVARQSPVLPFSLGNYFVGSATQAPIIPTLLGTICGCFPLNCVWVGAGAGGMAALDISLQSVAASSSSSISDDGMVGLGNVIANGMVNPQVAEGLEVIGVLATLAIVVTIGQAIAKVWNEDDEKEKGSDVEDKNGQEPSVLP